ncbi:MAG: hypothetical protein MZV70_22205 [Desulfobacterales bacterium]|nr:hypothetical protein [Desulfobacterales bacterium]
MAHPAFEDGDEGSGAPMAGLRTQGGPSLSWIPVGRRGRPGGLRVGRRGNRSVRPGRREHSSRRPSHCNRSSSFRSFGAAPEGRCPIRADARVFQTHSFYTPPEVPRQSSP